MARKSIIVVSFYSRYSHILELVSVNFSASLLNKIWRQLSIHACRDLTRAYALVTTSFVARAKTSHARLTSHHLLTCRARAASHVRGSPICVYAGAHFGTRSDEDLPTDPRGGSPTLSRLTTVMECDFLSDRN
ncbi:hypothetical protein PUN28_004843 [Cardiocondyla obscurior]|uniref:Uncharacterized protein n=1 Tax=Cardiocondyla obscurior TaxID=286306 RepID=A0AAW2GIU5_9HYME